LLVKFLNYRYLKIISVGSLYIPVIIIIIIVKKARNKAFDKLSLTIALYLKWQTIPCQTKPLI
jgi:hypothetical protein